jgi:hypothetical protein
MEVQARPKNRLKRRKIHTAARSRSARLLAQRGHFVRVAGEPVACEIERDNDPSRIDHLWITIRAGRFGSLRIAVNTCSLDNRDLGFDSRIRVGIIHSTWSELPAPGVFASVPLDYATIEAEHFLIFHEYERSAVESMLIEIINRARFVEGWGDLYVRGHIGIHQVHSRRASPVVRTDHFGRDGAIRFYCKEARTEMVLFKFFGQP